MADAYDDLLRRLQIAERDIGRLNAQVSKIPGGSGNLADGLTMAFTSGPQASAGVIRDARGTMRASALELGGGLAQAGQLRLANDVYAWGNNANKGLQAQFWDCIILSASTFLDLSTSYQVIPGLVCPAVIPPGPEWWIVQGVGMVNCGAGTAVCTAADVVRIKLTVNAIDRTQTGLMQAPGAAGQFPAIRNWRVPVLPGTAITATLSGINNTGNRGRMPTGCYMMIQRIARMVYAIRIRSLKPVAYWRLGEASGTTAVDLSGNSNTGTYTNGPTLAAVGALDGDPDTAVTFDGSNDYVAVAHNSTLALTGNITIEAWVKPTDYANFNGIVGKTLVNLPAPYDYYLTQTSGLPTFLRGNGTLSGSFAGATAPALGVWSHVVVTMSAANIVCHYLNGIQTSTGGFITTIADAGGALRIASRADGGTMMKGGLDEVAIYNYVLTPDQVLMNYQHGVGA